MRFYELVPEGYDKKRKCKTPGAIYSSEISNDSVEMEVELPFEIDLDKKESEDLEAKMHYALEKVLAPLFKK